MIKIPHGLITKSKKAAQEKNQLFSIVKRNINNGTLLKKFQCLQNKFISMKLMDPNTSVKTYWSILKICPNDKKGHASLFHDNKFLTDLGKKLNFAALFFEAVFYNRYWQ